MVWWGRGLDNYTETAGADPANQRPEPSKAGQSEARVMNWWSGDGAGIISDQADIPGWPGTQETDSFIKTRAVGPATKTHGRVTTKSSIIRTNKHGVRQTNKLIINYCQKIVLDEKGHLNVFLVTPARYLVSDSLTENCSRKDWWWRAVIKQSVGPLPLSQNLLRVTKFQF